MSLIGSGEKNAVTCAQGQRSADRLAAVVLRILCALYAAVGLTRKQLSNVENCVRTPRAVEQDQAVLELSIKHIAATLAHFEIFNGKFARFLAEAKLKSARAFLAFWRRECLEDAACVSEHQCFAWKSKALAHRQPGNQIAWKMGVAPAGPSIGCGSLGAKS